MPTQRFLSWLFSALLMAPGSAALAQAVAQLYAPRPPAGSSFVRVVSGDAGPMNVRIGARAPDRLSNETVSSIYRIVPGGIPLSLEIDGKAASEPVVPPADKFVTLIAHRIGDRFAVKVIVEEAEPIDGLRAELRLYNLVEGCNANLGVVGGPRVFEAIAANTNGRRTINPVATGLQGECSESRSAQWALPPLKSGDHYSLFLVGEPQHPRLIGQLDETEPYRAPTQ